MTQSHSAGTEDTESQCRDRGHVHSSQPPLSMARSLLQAVEISASQFLDIFHHYDNDGNGFIEGKELQNFIRELRDARQQAGLDLTDEMSRFVSECEKNSDRRIGLAQLVHILPTEENFLLFFRQQLTCSHFIKVWRRYDADHSGYIEADELKSFLKDLLLKAQRPCDENKLDEYTAATLKIFDSDFDGKLSLSEMSRLLPDEQNFLLKLQGVKMSKCVFNRVFDLYDQDSSGFIEDTQLEALLTHTQVLDCADVPRCLPVFMQLSDGGKLHRSDLSLLLCHTKDTPPSPCPAHI